MATVTEFADLKVQLEERIRNLEEESSTLHRDIRSLNETITIKTLERSASSLQRQVESLRVEKLSLEERLSRLSFEDSTAESVSLN